jgi:pyoverdine/dityrosine biosynthesis protein Dit1
MDNHTWSQELKVNNRAKYIVTQKIHKLKEKIVMPDDLRIWLLENIDDYINRMGDVWEDEKRRKTFTKFLTTHGLEYLTQENHLPTKTYKKLVKTTMYCIRHG